MFDLTGRKALVTGATGGIGGAIARALHAQGATVTLSGTRRSALDELAASLGERVHVVEANLSDKDSVEALVPAAESAMEGLDILVNNAGVTKDNLFMRMKDEEWDTVIAVNLTAAFRLSRAAVKNMMRRRNSSVLPSLLVMKMVFARARCDGGSRKVPRGNRCSLPKGCCRSINTTSCRRPRKSQY